MGSGGGPCTRPYLLKAATQEQVHLGCGQVSLTLARGVRGPVGCQGPRLAICKTPGRGECWSFGAQGGGAFEYSDEKAQSSAAGRDNTRRICHRCDTTGRRRSTPKLGTRQVSPVISSICGGSNRVVDQPSDGEEVQAVALEQGQDQIGRGNFEEGALQVRTNVPEDVEGPPRENGSKMDYGFGAGTGGMRPVM